MRLARSLALVPALLAVAACSESTAPLAPESAISATRGAVTPSKPASGTTITDIVVASATADEPQFTILLSLVQRLGLADELAARGQRTVFAPTDAAFQALIAQLTESGNLALLEDDAFVRDVLLYHIAPGNRDAAEVVGSERIRMANGDFTHISVRDAGPFINDSQIVDTNIFASNGVVHVINAVLLPK